MTPLSLSLSLSLFRFSELKLCTEFTCIHTQTHTQTACSFLVYYTRHKFRTSLPWAAQHSVWKLTNSIEFAPIYERHYNILYVERVVELVCTLSSIYLVSVYISHIMRRALEASASIMPLGLCAFIIACCIFTVYLAKFKRENCTCALVVLTISPVCDAEWKIKRICMCTAWDLNRESRAYVNNT
jgi:hypothetical protein